MVANWNDVYQLTQNCANVTNEILQLHPSGQNSS